MKRTIELISVVAIAMALTLTIAFSGVAVASPTVPTTKETEVIDISTDIECSGTVVESQWLSLEIDSVNLTDNPPLDNGEIYGKIGYDEKMIGSSGSTNFCKYFKVNTGTAPNLDVSKTIVYAQTPGDWGFLSHDEDVEMIVIAAGKTTTAKKTTYHICPFDKPEPKTTTTKVPGSCEEVHVYGRMAVMTDVEATTDTTVGITGVPGNPVNLNYEITAQGAGLVVAGVDVYVADGIGGTNSTLGSRLMYKEKSSGWGNVTFCKKIGYESILP